MKNCQNQRAKPILEEILESYLYIKAWFSTFLLNKFEDIGPENEELAEKKQKEKKESAEETLQSQMTLNTFDTQLFRVKKQLFPNCLALIQVDYKALKPTNKESFEFRKVLAQASTLGTLNNVLQACGSRSTCCLKLIYRSKGLYIEKSKQIVLTNFRQESGNTCCLRLTTINASAFLFTLSRNRSVC